MSDVNPYRAQWDQYAETWDPQNIPEGSLSELTWPGDEWGDKETWSTVFQTMFLDYGATDWKNCVEIGPGSGKYTNYLLRNSATQILAFDISPAYLEILKKRLATDIDAGRLHPLVLNGDHASEMLEELTSRQLVRELDAVYSIDAMVHVDLQYLIVYFVTAALCLKEGGRLIVTLANAISDLGFDLLINDAAPFYPLQGTPNAKFEWLSHEIVQQVLERLGFAVQFISPYQDIAELRDMWVVGTLVNLDRAESFQKMFPTNTNPTTAVE